MNYIIIYRWKVNSGMNGGERVIRCVNKEDAEKHLKELCESGNHQLVELHEVKCLERWENL